VNGLLGQLASIVVPNVGFFFRKKMSKVILWHKIDELGAITKKTFVA
jgi:hypothetical protein